MTSPRRFEQDMPALLADLYLAGTPDYRDDLVRQIAGTRQRPAWAFPGRWLPMELTTARVPATRLPTRQLGVLALIAILLAAALAVYIGSHQQKLPPPFGVARNGAMLYGSGGDIYRLDPVTGVSTPLLTGTETDQLPFYSRDGTRFAFFRQTGAGLKPTNYQLVVANVDGSGQRVISTDPVTFDYSINWSADGRSIILDDTHGHVTRLDTIGNAPPEKITYPKVADIIALRPPEEGDFLYRTVTAEGWSLQIMDTEGSSARPVFSSGGTSMRDDDYSGYQWSPDGSKIAFRTHPDVSDEFRIYIVNADGTDLHRLTHETGIECECDMFWSPDGTQIAFNRSRLEPSTGEWHVRPVGIASVVDGVVRDIGPQPPDQGGEFAFSPDGASMTWLPRRSADSIATTKDEPLLLDVASGTSRRISVPVDSPPDWQRLAR